MILNHHNGLSIVPFDVLSYQYASNKQQYIQNLLYSAVRSLTKQSEVNKVVLSYNEMQQIMKSIHFELRISQLHQLYWHIIGDIDYKSRKPKPSINKNEKIIAKWLHQHLQSKSIRTHTNRKKQQYHSRQHSRCRKYINQSLGQQLTQLIQIFEGMQKERQNSGLIPIDEHKQGDQLQILSASIPYDPELHDLNNKLCSYRLQAEERLARIIQLAKNNQQIGNRLERAIQKFQYERISTNQKVGRIAAYNAHQRLQQQRQLHQQKIKSINLVQNGQNIIHAMYINQLLCTPVKKCSKFIV